MNNAHKERLSNFELLRIFAMLMIIAAHYACHGVQKVDIYEVKLIEWGDGTLVNRIFTCLLLPGGTIGVEIFFMISGYFMCKKKNFSLHKIYFQSLYYGIIITALWGICKISGVEIPYLTKTNVISFAGKSILLPLTSGCWWFITAYTFLMILSPTLNTFIGKLNRKGYLILIVVIWLFWYVVLGATLGTIFFKLQQAIICYILGAYFRLFSQKKGYTKLAIVMLVICWICSSVISYQSSFIAFHNYTTISQVGERLMNATQAIFIPLSAISVFYIFKNMNIGSNKIINLISATTFGIYLIHDSIIGRDFIWCKIINVTSSQYVYSLFPVYALLSIIIVFIVCSIIDLPRLLWLEPIMLEKFKVLSKKAKIRYWNSI